MNNYVKILFLSLGMALLTPFSCKAISNEIWQSLGSFEKAKYIVEHGYDALSYIGRDQVIKTLDGVSAASNNLVKNGITLHFGPHKIIPQIGFCSVGILASACGLGVITHTALQNDQKDTKRKYLIGAGMLTLGIASLATSGLFSLKN